jgi:DNA-binding MarR family transcriptional regulator
MRYVGGVRRDSIHVELLRALAFAPERTPANARELAEVLGTSVQFVAAKLRPLVSAGLVSRDWGSVHGPGRTYLISEEGRDYLMRLGAEGNRNATAAPSRGFRLSQVDAITLRPGANKERPEA